MDICCRKTDVKCAYLRFLMYNIYLSSFSENQMLKIYIYCNIWDTFANQKSMLELHFIKVPFRTKLVINIKAQNKLCLMPN